jgi:aryl-alcohol dehydrogenase-like predicted oxidoreductase
MILRNPNRLGLILGTEVYGREALATSVFSEILEMGLSSGAIGIDTASSYGDGRVEKLIGDSLGERENNGLV